MRVLYSLGLDTLAIQKRSVAIWVLAMSLLLGYVPAGSAAQMFDIHELARQPFNAAGDSDTTKIKFAVPVEGNYSVLIDILYDENTQGALRGAQLAGGIVPDQWGEPGLSFDVRVVVFDPTANMEVVKEYKRRPKIISYGSGHVRVKIGTYRLLAGDYQLSLERIGRASSLVGHEASISVTKAYVGK